MVDLPTIRRSSITQGGPIVGISDPGAGTRRLAAGMQQLGQGAADVAQVMKAHYLADFEQDQRRAAAELWSKNMFNPQGFINAWDGRTTGALSEVPGMVKARAEVTMKAIGTSTYSRILTASTTRTYNQGQDAWNDLTGIKRREYMAHVVAGTAATPEGKAAADAYFSHLNRGVSAKYISPEHRDIATRQLEEDTKAETLARTFKPDAKPSEVRDALRKQFPALPPSRVEYYVSRFRERKAETKAELNEARRTLRADVYKKYFAPQSGTTTGNLDPAKATDDIAKLRAVGDDEMADRLQFLTDNHDRFERFSRLPQADLTAEVRALQGRAASGDKEAVLDLKMAETVYRSRMQALKADPFGYAANFAARDTGAKPEPLPKITDTDAYFAALEGRLPTARKVSDQLFGGSPIVPMYADEISRLREALKVMPASVKTDFLRRLSDTLGDRHFRKLTQSLATGAHADDTARFDAMTAIAAKEQPEVARMMVDGREALAENKNYAPKNDVELRRQVDTHLSDVFANLPADARTAYEERIKAIYAYKSKQAGDTTGELNMERLRESLKAGAPLVEVNGKKTFPPRPGMPQRDFDKVLDTVTDSDLGSRLPIASDGSQVKWEDIRKHGRLIPAGEGKYLVTINGFRLTDPATGRPFVLDVNPVIEGLDRSADDLFPQAPSTTDDERRDQERRKGMTPQPLRDPHIDELRQRLKDKRGAAEPTVQPTNYTAQVDDTNVVADPSRDGYTEPVDPKEATVTVEPSLRPKASSLVMPLSGFRVTSNFGKRRHPILGYTRMHTGMDLAAPSGTPVTAAMDGKVVYSGWKGGYGNYIVVEHPDGTRTAYGHLSKRGVQVGAVVKAGSEIGKVGSTGRSTGPHLHFEVMDRSGRFINPRKLIGDKL